MNETKKGGLSNARTVRARSPMSDFAFEVVCDSAIGPMRIPYATRSQADSVAAFINSTGLFPDNKLAFIS